MKRYYRDAYGCTASISETPKSATLRVCNAHGTCIHKRRYGSYRGARTAMGRMSDGWREVA